jgi:ribosomal protein S18 acetylase RimI-like enzyme
MISVIPQRLWPTRRVLSISVCLWALLAAASAAMADRPSAMKLFPEETLLLVRTPNLSELFEQYRETATGRMVRDPQLEKFVERLYGSAGDLYTEKVAELLGVSWEELQNLPQGEVAFAIVARRDHGPAFVLLVDQGDAPSVARKLLDSAIERAQEIGGDLSTETIEGEEVTVIRDDDNQHRNFGLFERENTIVAATDPGLLRAILRRWNADGTSAAAATDQTDDEALDDEATLPRYGSRSLAENEKLVTMLRQCRRPQDPPPSMIIFADPIELLREFGRDSAGLKVAMAAFPALGIDGLEGICIAGSASTGQYDDLTHMHVLLRNPRAGVMQVIAFEPGDTSPQPFVFAELESYIAWNWNVRASFDAITALVDRFQFEGATQEFITEKMNESLGIDFEADVIDNLGKRFCMFAGYERPAHFRGQQSTIAVELVDPALGEKTLATIIAKFAEHFEERQFGDVTYYAAVIEWPEELADDPPNSPCVAVMDGYLLVSGSCQLLERTVEARDGTVERLADSPDYRMMVDQVRRETPGVTPALWLYSRFEETLRQWYEVLQADRTRDFLDERAEGNPFFTALLEASCRRSTCWPATPRPPAASSTTPTPASTGSRLRSATTRNRKRISPPRTRSARREMGEAESWLERRWTTRTGN